MVSADLADALPSPWALPALLAVALSACFVRSRFPFQLSLSLLFFVWGALSLSPFLRPVDHLVAVAGDEPALVEGVVDQRPEGTVTGGAKLYLQVERLWIGSGETAAHGRLLVYVREGRVPFCSGDRVVFRSRIRQPRDFGLPGEVEQARRLAYQGIFATGFVLEASEIVLLRSGAGLAHRVDRLAASLGRFIEKEVPGSEGGVLKALLLGDKGDVPEQLQDAYARSGVNHILSISGFHVGIVFLAVFHLMYFAARRSETLALRLNLKQLLPLSVLPVLLFYLLLSGAAPATLRSVLMICAVVAALHLRRELDPINTVMLAACAILFVSPQIFFEVSFQLSFLAIWGLAVLAPPLAGRFAGVPALLRWLLLLAVASLAAVVATLVPVAYYFQRVSLIGLVANLLVVPLMGYGAVVAGFASLCLSHIYEPAAQALLQLAALLVRVSDRVIEYLSLAPVLTGYVPGKLDLLLACLALCAVTFPKSRIKRLAALSPLLLALVWRAVPSGATGSGLMHLYFLSVGQGDATLAHLPDGKWMLVDGGGNANDTSARVGPRLLLPALRALGVRRIDYLVLTHEHPDHLQGVSYLAARFEVGEFWESALPSSAHDYRQLKWILAARGVPVRRLDGEGSVFAAGGAVVQSLWPLAAGQPASDDANDSSLVFRLSHGGASVLLTGDLRENGERALLARGTLSPSSLLKVAHHGSRHSTCEEFLAALSPKEAVISSGYANVFRLPAPSTISRLQRHGVRVYRTDQEGTIEAVMAPDGKVTVSVPWGHFN
ncbi:DNA internalization-related competence protein ComEC/Rec2 [Citrifermentans bremense]|uniref:DNA internalization-related competence protein ComEC/Rec2 n=1 Tax=Citrifermentans bremense TaxID=60035 RepID=A0A7R7FS03_9BACT|nr:DNA internalization-related competence protein ComEC/Rec2 [Citrifermentans bremense]BCO11256.1 DNA internalization-related competence protein ComEC/Rec2 [Citrifermentans bremense]